MQTRADLLDQTLRKLAAERIETLRDMLERPVSDLTSHNFTVGRIAGLRDLDEILAEATTILSQR